LETNRKPSGSIYKSYFRMLFLSRLALLAFWACFFYFVVWAMPWIPGGLSVSDYSWDLVATLVIAGSCMFIGLIATTLRSTVHRKREALVAWAFVYDETTGLHNRRYFYDCLALECDRSRRHGAPFAIALLELQFPGTRNDRHTARANRTTLRAAAELVKDLARATDLVALISEREFAVLFVGAQHDVARRLAERLRQFVNTGLPALTGSRDPCALPTVEVGIGAFGEDSSTPESLIEAARSALSESASVTSTTTKAA